MNSMTSPRAKVVVAVFAAIGAIAGLHFLLFRQNAQDYQEAKLQYDTVRQELEQIGSPKAWSDIYQFRYRTINYELNFWRMLRDAGLCADPVFVEMAATPEEMRDLQERHAGLIWDYLHQIERLRTLPGTKLAFMGGDRPMNEWKTDPTWAIMSELPSEVRQSGRALSDSMSDLSNTNRLMANIPKESTLWAQQNDNYVRQLYNVGFNIYHRDGWPGIRGINENFGELTGILYTLNRIDLIKRNIPRGEFGFQTETEYNRRLFEIFRLKLDEFIWYHGYKQLQSLVDVIEIARKNDLREISSVKLWEYRDLVWPPPSLEEAPPQAATSGAGAFSAMFEGDPAMMGMDPAMMGMDPAMMGMDPMMMGMDYYMGGMPQEVAPPVDESFATAVPIEMTVVGTNSNVMAFLYDLTHNKRTYQIDAVDVWSMPREENVIGAKIVLKAMSSFKKFAPTEQEVEEKILGLLQRKKEIATRPGAKELAEEEGFLAEMDQIPSPAPAEAVVQPDPVAGNDQGLGLM